MTLTYKQYTRMAKKDRFNYKSFKKGDDVLVVTSPFNMLWQRDKFDGLFKSGDSYFCKGVKNEWTVHFCIPYNDDTKHLEGVNGEAPAFYRYWEDDPTAWF